MSKHLQAQYCPVCAQNPKGWVWNTLKFWCPRTAPWVPGWPPSCMNATEVWFTGHRSDSSFSSCLTLSTREAFSQWTAMTSFCVIILYGGCVTCHMSTCISCANASWAIWPSPRRGEECPIPRTHSSFWWPASSPHKNLPGMLDINHLCRKYIHYNPE